MQYGMGRKAFQKEGGCEIDSVGRILANNKVIKYLNLNLKNRGANNLSCRKKLTVQ